MSVIKGRPLPTSPNRFQGWTKRPIDAEIVAAAGLLSAVLVVGLATAAEAVNVACREPVRGNQIRAVRDQTAACGTWYPLAR
jgi:hypothetical protein